METSGTSANQCLRCKSAGPLLRIDPGLRLRIDETLPSENIPPEVCANCFKQITSLVSSGAKLMREQNAREQNKMNLWRNRVNILKHGRKLMTLKSYSDAAVAYEKYLRILEVVYDVKAGGLTPEHFKNSARTKEISVVASVYWDLVRIYDTTPRYGDRQKKSIEKLLSFLRLSPISSEIGRKARQFEPTAKNQAVIKDFIKRIDKKGGGCFIATATYQNVEVFEVRALCAFRDQVLANSAAGRFFIKSYYLFSPPVAELVDSSPRTQKLLKKIFRALAPWLNQKFDLHTPEDV